MTALDALGVAVYVVALVLTGAAAAAVIWLPRFKSPTAPLVVGATSFFLGAWIAVFATADWNPLPMLLAFVPFALIAFGLIPLGLYRERTAQRQT